MENYPITNLSSYIDTFRLLAGSSGAVKLSITSPEAGGVWASGVSQISAQDQNGGQVVTNYQ